MEIKPFSVLFFYFHFASLISFFFLQIYFFLRNVMCKMKKYFVLHHWSAEDKSMILYFLQCEKVYGKFHLIFIASDNDVVFRLHLVFFIVAKSERFSIYFDFNLLSRNNRCNIEFFIIWGLVCEDRICILCNLNIANPSYNIWSYISP